jgi:lipopolysaccharide transport system permease protein
MSLVLPVTLRRAQRELIGNLVSRDVKTRYKQSSLGYAWAILNPLAFAVIYTIVGQYIMKSKAGVLPFPVHSYFGLLYWNLFAAGLTASTESLVGNLPLITKIYFPREVFPISAVLSKVVDFAFGLVGLIPLLLIYHTPIRPLTFPLAILMALILLVYTTGLGMLMACLNLFYRDFRHLVGIALSLGSFLVPNIYAIGYVPKEWRSVYLLNPLAALIEAARRAAFPQSGWMRWVHTDPSNHPNESLESLWLYVGSAALVAVVTFLIGYAIFKRNEPRFAEFI